MTNNFTPAKAGQQSKRLSKEEYAEKMKAEKEAVYQMADDTAKAIVSDPEKFKAFLDTQSRLDRYSAVNALLIFKQLPEASQLKNFDDWSKDNVKIQKGAKSISILEPVEYAKKDGTTGISYNVWCCIIKVDTLFSRILIYNHNQYENRRKTYGTESKIL